MEHFTRDFSKSNDPQKSEPEELLRTIPHVLWMAPGFWPWNTSFFLVAGSSSDSELRSLC